MRPKVSFANVGLMHRMLALAAPSFSSMSEDSDSIRRLGLEPAELLRQLGEGSELRRGEL